MRVNSLCFTVFILTIISCGEKSDRISIIFPDEYLEGKTEDANGCIVRFPNMELKEVSIYTGEHLYRYISQDEIIYDINFKHYVNIDKSWDTYWDSEYSPIVNEIRLKEESYTKDSCLLIMQIEFGTVSLLTKPVGNSKFTKEELISIKNQFNKTTFRKINKQEYLSASKLIEGNTELTADKSIDSKTILNGYFEAFKQDSIYSFLSRNSVYIDSILINGDIINVYKHEINKYKLVAKYVYLNSSKESLNEGCGVTYINNRAACVYLIKE